MPSQTSSRTAYRFRSCATICPLAGPLPVNLGLISLRSELSDSVKPTSAHNALTNIVENGVQVQILRDNMPFGRPAAGEFGTYFIGYSRSPRVTEQMIENMFVGRPPGNYDRLLDFSRAVTGSLFFVPSATFLDNISGKVPESAETVGSQTSDLPSAPPVDDGSLKIGSLKGEKDE